MASEDDFKQAMQAAGVDPPPDLVADGTLHRYSSGGDRSKNSWYILFADDPAAGKFGCWKRGISETWCSKGYQNLSPAEKARYRANMEAAKNLRDAELSRLQADCRTWCADHWKQSKDASDNHPYLKKKGVHAYGLKAMRDALLVPLYDTAGVMQGMQFIQPDSSKTFKTGTAKQGSYFPIGKPKDNTLLICEGYATGASLHQATGHAVAVAFDAGNLKPVAEALRLKYPALRLIICADNDQWGDTNTGVTKATEAAQAVGGWLTIANFRDTTGKPTDFNDLHQQEGLEAVRQQVAAAQDLRFAKVDEQQEPAAEPVEEWPEPLPLPDSRPAVKPLDEALIPAPLRGWLLDIAERMQIPPDFSTAAAIVALGSIIGRGCGIHPKQQDDWLVVPNLWGAVIGRPSMMKTPAMSEAFKPIDRLEIDAREQHQSSVAGHDFDQLIKEEAEKSMKDAIKKAIKAGDTAAVDRLRDQYRNDQLTSSAEPVRRRFFTSDATPEKICHLLNENPRGMLLKRDELIGWLANLDRDGRENARSMFLEGWNGTGRYSYDTIKDGTIDVEALCLSVFGAITPGRLASYIYQANKGGAGDDGLMQRFQLAVWPDAPADWKMIDRWPDTTEKNRAYAIFSALAGEIPGAETTGNADIPALRFTPDAQLVFNDWLQELENRLRKTEGLTPALESHLAKYRSLMPSLALIYHLVDVVDGTTPPGPVSVRAAAMAAGMCEYLESHALRIYSGGSSPGMESAREIIRRIQKGDIKDGSTIREIWRPQWSRLTTSEEVQAGLEILQLYEWLTVKTAKTGGRPTQTISLNPRIILSA